MFGTNEIVGQSYFKEAKDNELFITSAFYTLQGEGPLSGRPAFFIRLAKCNLSCHFCDSFFDDGDWYTFDQTLDLIERTIDEYFSSKEMERPNWTHHSDLNKKEMALILTGGEPTLQKNIGPFLEKMNNIFKWTQIESNGIIHQPSIPDDTILVISPKCLEKDKTAIRYIKPNLKNLERADCLKFIMDADGDNPYHEIPNWALDWQGRKEGKDIFVSPINIYNELPQKTREARTSGKNRLEIDERSTVEEVFSFWTPGMLNIEANQKNHEYTANYCIQHGLRFQVQAHLYAGLA